MTWSLPAELDDIIIDYFHDDPATLATCALVQRSWAPRARHHFWRELHLTCTREELEKVGSMLDKSPDIAFHVRDVVLSQKKGEMCQWYDLHLLHSALYILARFPSLTSVKFDGLWFGAPKDSENTPHRLTFPTVRRLCVSTCTFDAFDDVQQLCAVFPALSRLQFDGVWWGRWAADKGFASGDKQGAKPLMLRELDLGSCFSRDRVIDWLLATLPEPSVERLRLPLVGAYDTRLRDLLQFVGPSLQHLELGSPSSSTIRTRTGVEEKPLATYLDMSHNTGLRTIQLGVPTYRDASYISLWLKTILGQVASPLEEVRFAVYPILKGDAPEAKNMLRAFAWKDLTSVLQKSQFAKLKRVVFVSGRSKDYLNVPGAFIALQPLLRKIMVPEFAPLTKQGVEIAFEDV
ncbi:uncharacterized protein PHACADRAFT_187939 [Phanerochaete carnosa HHB-10118-sp]|uniref:F-box domain-containing protein n=1 Tax=Phanerochaete carnosa (strain HHB-10118-sp) TaxID=650164 RepID=K5VXV7_PHACS|nr:uncharacterized protein PHACADRAFT_187939 [Phanerochaete carnosa HHB-10118-sp]EKM51429.1 hypothetical protein PHACADRAFT_187939 [Phanerochaete carnosa HHB-10118-sp]